LGFVAGKFFLEAFDMAVEFTIDDLRFTIAFRFNASTL
jgi:hypothetical protein